MLVITERDLVRLTETIDKFLQFPYELFDVIIIKTDIVVFFDELWIFDRFCTRQVGQSLQ